MKPKKTGKLRLLKQTINNLNDLQMQKINGGDEITVGCTQNCTVTCQTNCDTCWTQLMCTGCKPSRTYCD